MIADNLKSVRQRIATCCEKISRDPQDIQLVCVTKEVEIPEIEMVMGLGVREIGENRVQEALAKYRVIGQRALWHLVGHLQTNKARDAVTIFSLIHSIDSIHLARAIDKEAGKIGKVQDVLVQVNVSGEDTKFGISSETTTAFIHEISSCRNIAVKGLMTIAPEAGDPEDARPYFRRLRETFEEVRRTHAGMRYLSMGMSGDLETAIEEGANIVRVGRAIFGERERESEGA